MDWLKSPMGHNLLAQEQLLAGRVLERVFGDQIVQLGAWGAADSFLQAVRTQYSILLDAEVGAGVNALGAPDRLPILTDTVDAVLLPHTLELTADPHGVLREVHRILRPDGRLIILGFNPVSWWGLRHRLSPEGFPPGVERQISQRRLADWLRLLNFRILSINGCYGTAAKGRVSRLVHRWAWFASVYMLVATKGTIPLTIIRPQRRHRASLVTGLVNPTTRNVA